MHASGRRATSAVWLAGIVLVLCSNLGRPGHTEEFDWRNIGGQSFVSGVRNQEPAGTCWAFSATGALEAKYMITRNDPSFAPDLSEQNLVCPGTMGTINGGWEFSALDYFRTTGIVSEFELPYTAQDTSSDWPLQAGWQDRVWKASSVKCWLTNSVTELKAAMKNHGPLVATMSPDIDWYSPPPGVNRGRHGIVLTGFHDDANVPGGGYWIVKNSWGGDWNGNGYGAISYATLQVSAAQGLMDGQTRVHAIDGPVYCTGPLATATWQGGSGTWAAGNSIKWSNGVPYAWENKETAAVFNSSGQANVQIEGTVIAHSLTVAAGATGYSMSGGALTVTAGGITANEDVQINSPVTVGAPQNWTTAAGKTLTIGGDVHTVISPLTVEGAGTTYIVGAIDGGGLANAAGAPAGKLTKNGTGRLTIAGASNYGSAIAINAGTLNLAPGQGITALYSGAITGGGSMTKSGAGTVRLSGNNSYSGGTTIGDGMLQATLLTSLPGYNTVGKVVVSNGGTLAVNVGGSGEFRASDIPTLANKIDFHPGSFLGIDTSHTSGSGLSYGYPLSGDFGLMKLGAKSLILSASDTFTLTGEIRVQEGTLSLPNGMPQTGGAIMMAIGTNLRAAGEVHRAIRGTGRLTATADLTVGDIGQSDQFDLGGLGGIGGTLDIGSNQVTLNSSDQVVLGSSNSMGNGGSLTTLHGARLGGESAVDATKVLAAEGNVFIVGDFVNNGLVDGPDGIGHYLTFQGNVTGAGNTIGNVLYSGSYSPGNSPALVSSENLFFDPVNTLFMEIGGLLVGTEYDQLNVLGQANLHGTLSLNLLDQYQLEAGRTYQLIVGSTVGEFDQIVGLPAGWSCVYTATGVSLVPEPSTLIMFGFAVLVMALCARRFRRC